MTRSNEAEFLYAGADEIPLLRELGVVMVGRGHQHRAYRTLGQHRDGGVEVCTCIDGVYRWLVEGNEQTVRAGETSVTRPWETHGGVDDLMGPGTLEWVILAAGGVPGAFTMGVPSIPEIDRRWIHHVVGRPGVVPPFRDRRVAEDVRGVVAVILDEPPGKPGFATAVSAAVARLCVDAARALADQRSRDGGRPSGDDGVGADGCTTWPAGGAGPSLNSIPHSVRRTLRRVAADPAASWTVEAMAADAGMAARTFSRWCRTGTGRSPRWYVLDCRLREARRRLADTDQPITAVAFDLGFSSSQHFATAFRRMYACTPGQFRRRSR